MISTSSGGGELDLRMLPMSLTHGVDGAVGGYGLVPRPANPECRL